MVFLGLMFLFIGLCPRLSLLLFLIMHGGNMFKIDRLILISILSDFIQEFDMVSSREDEVSLSSSLLTFLEGLNVDDVYIY